jgi:hypothetical protein
MTPTFETTTRFKVAMTFKTTGFSEVWARTTATSVHLYDGDGGVYIPRDEFREVLAALAQLADDAGIP